MSSWRWSILLALLFLASSARLMQPAPAIAQELEIPSVTIAGGNLAHVVELAPADADAFRRRVNKLPRFEDPPSVSGPRYTVTTSYWPAAVRLDEDEGEDILDVDVRGDYYPEGGYVRVSVSVDDGGEAEDVWMALNLRQRAILDRYIRLANAGLIGEAPSTMDVLAASSPMETFGVQAGAEVIDEATASELLTRLSETNPDALLDELEPPRVDDDGFWLIVTLMEGRSHRYYVQGDTLTEALGTERYDTSTLTDLIGSIRPPPVAALTQQEPAGSLLWWPVSIGGGVAAIAAAVWLRRKSVS